MIQSISEPVSVTLHFDHKLRKAMPQEIKWGSHVYPVTKLGLHHTYFEGRVLRHVFAVMAGPVFFRLVLNTQSLAWTLTELDDGVGG